MAPTIINNTSDRSVAHDSCNLAATDYSDILNFSQRMVAGVVLTIICFVSVFANIFLWVSIIHVKELHKTMHFLLLSLSASDLIVSIVNMPITSYTIFYGSWNFSCGVCQASAFSLQLGGVATIMSLAAVSLNRYIRICHQYWYSDWYDDRLWIHVSIVWLLSLGLSLGTIFATGEFSPKYFKHSYWCGMGGDMTNPVSLIITLIFVIVMLIVIFCNIGILYTYYHAKFPIVKHPKRVSTKKSVLRREIQRIYQRIRSSFLINKVAPQPKEDISVVLADPPVAHTNKRKSTARAHFAEAEEMAASGDIVQGQKTVNEKDNDTKGTDLCNTNSKFRPVPGETAVLPERLNETEDKGDKNDTQNDPNNARGYTDGRATTPAASPTRATAGPSSAGVETIHAAAPRVSIKSTVSQGAPNEGLGGTVSPTSTSYCTSLSYFIGRFSCKGNKGETDSPPSHESDHTERVASHTAQRGDAHLVRALTSVVAAYCVFYLPLAIVKMIKMQTSIPVSPAVELFATILVLANSMMNPIIYGLGNLKIRQGYWDVLDKLNFFKRL